MFRNFKLLSVILVAALMMLVAFAPLAAHADDDVYREGTVAGKMFKKLGRGVVNILTGWMEVPKHMAKRWRQYDPITGIIVGGVEGFGWAFCRTLTGAYDVISFPFAVPKDYQPLMQPEFLLPTIWGESIPEMDGVSGLRPLAP